MPGFLRKQRLLLFMVLASACADTAAIDPPEIPAPALRGVPLQGVPGVPVARMYDLDAHGDGYVLLDGPNARLLFVSATGDVLRAIGRHGGAPGEFRDAQRAASARDGRVAVLDPPFVTVLDASGRVSSKFTTRPSLGGVSWGSSATVMPPAYVRCLSRSCIDRTVHASVHRLPGRRGART
jgi:hypothetical protein